MGDSVDHDTLVSSVALALYVYGLGLEALERRHSTPRRRTIDMCTSLYVIIMVKEREAG